MIETPFFKRSPSEWCWEFCLQLLSEDLSISLYWEAAGDIAWDFFDRTSTLISEEAVSCINWQCSVGRVAQQHVQSTNNLQDSDVNELWMILPEPLIIDLHCCLFIYIDVIVFFF